MNVDCWMSKVLVEILLLAVEQSESDVEFVLVERSFSMGQVQ